MNIGHMRAAVNVAVDDETGMVSAARRTRRRCKLYRGMAGLLTAVMCIEALLGNGVSTAIAETVQNDAEWQQVADQIVDANSTAEDAASGAGDGVSEGSTVVGDEDSVSSDEDSTRNDSSEGTASDASVDSDTDVSDNSGNDAQSSGSTETALAPRDWTSATDALVLSSEGLDWDDSLALLAKKIAEANDADSGEDTEAYGQAADTLDDVILPSKLPANLDVRMHLDAMAGSGRMGDSAAEHNKLVAGDTFTIDLPSQVTANLSSDKLTASGLDRELAVYQRDSATGDATKVKIATAKVCAAKLVVTVCAPVNTETGAAGELGSSIDGVLALDVDVDSALVAKDEHFETWTLQCAGDGGVRTAELAIPSKLDIAVALGLYGVRGDEVMPAALDDRSSALNGDDDPEVGDIKYEVSGTTTSQEFTTRWADNGSASRPTASELQDRSEYRLYYSVDGGATRKALTQLDDSGALVLTAQARVDLHIESLDEYGSPLVSVSSETAGTYVARSTDKLPAKVLTKRLTDITVDDETGEKTYTWDTVASTNVSYYIKHETAGDAGLAPTEGAQIYSDAAGVPQYQVLRSSDVTSGDVSTYSEDFVVETLQLLQDVAFSVKLSIGREAYEEDSSGASVLKDFGALESQLADTQTLRCAHGSVQDTKAMANLLKDAIFEATWSDGANTTGILTSRMPAYYADGQPYTYSLVQSEIKTETQDETWGTLTDATQVWYDNAKSTGYGTSTEAAYPDGAVVVTRAGTTRYSGAKKWLDADPSERPATTYTLWRYADNGTADWKSAAQVKAGSSFVKIAVSAEENQAAAGDIDLGAKLKDVLGEYTLAKYDPNGYPYIYALREDAPSGYERLYGSEVETDPTKEDYGKIIAGTDSEPNYYAADGVSIVTASTASGGRSSSDQGVYNGGTIINRRTATVAASAIKKWVCGSYQDQLTDVSTTFTLKRILKKHATRDGSGNWVPNGDKDAAGAEITWSDSGVRQTVNGWNAENLTRAITASGIAAYDAEGNEYVYRWFETDVSASDSKNVQVVRAADGSVSSFSITFAGGRGEPDPVLFDVSVTTDADGGVVITNRYSDATDTTVDKYWARVKDGQVVRDEEGNIVYEQDASSWDEPVRSVAMRLVQLGASGSKTVLTFALDGLPEGAPTPFEIDGTTATYQETRSWHVAFNNLPKYDQNGSRYSYRVFENAGSGYQSSHAYNAATYATTVFNVPDSGTGESTTVHLSASWTDGGNTSSRVPVRVGVYAKRDLQSADGTTRYAAGELITTATLNVSNSWYTEVSVPISGLDTGAASEDLYIREVDNGETAASSSTVITRDQAVSDSTGAYTSLLMNWDETGASQWNERMLSSAAASEKGFCYEVSYGYNALLDSLQVNNRRLGQIQLTINKGWTDAGYIVGTRAAARFCIQARASAGVTYTVDDEGVVYANVAGGNTLKLYTYANGVTGADAQLVPLTTDAADISADGSCLYIIVDTNADTSSYPIVSLPKYDGSGNVIDYSVTEEYTEDADDYVSTRGDAEESYVSDWHFGDSIAYTFTNVRRGIKSVTFCSRWYDWYVKHVLGQRPDIYLTLYKTVYEYDETGSLVLDDEGNPVYTLAVVDGYENCKWDADTSQDDVNGVTNETVTISGLPKYDAAGKEVFYYAVANLGIGDAAARALDYIDPWCTTGLENADGSEKTGYDKGNAIWDTHNESDPARTFVSDTVEVGSGLAAKTALREDGTFNFALESTTNISGVKLWKNVPESVSADDLPAISLYVQRRVSGSDTAWSMPVFEEDSSSPVGYRVADVVDEDGSDVADGKTVVAYTRDLSLVSSNRFGFTLAHYGLNTAGDSAAAASALPRYDSFGRRYAYRVIEVVDGLLDQPGGFTLEQLNSYDPDSAERIDGVYVSDTVDGSYSITNTYQPKTGNLTVKKIYDDVESTDTLPDTTFTLWRFYVKGDGTKSELECVASKTLLADGLTDAAGTVTFENLEKYAPNGSYWLYSVGETSIDGYETKVKLGNAEVGDSGYTDPVSSAAYGLLSPDLMSDGDTLVGDDESPDVTFKNEYYPRAIKLNGMKVWYDQANVAGTRPNRVALTLRRTYADGAADASLPDGMLDLQENEPTGVGYLTWTKSDTGSWAYTISNLEMWAPNGKKWVYTVAEDEDCLYGTEYYIVKNGGKVAASEGAKLPDIVNGLTVSAAVVKKWANDSDTTWAQRPRLYYQLQARLGSSGTWSDAGAVLAGDAGGWAETTLELPNGSALSGHVLPSSGSTIGFVDPTGRDGDTWSGKTWEYLPKTLERDGAAYQVEYRVVEKFLVYDWSGASPSVVELEDPNADGSYGDKEYYPYQPSLATVTSETGEKTVVTSTMTNTLKQTSVSVQKSWDDQDNAWGTRPGTLATSDTWSVQFALQRTVDGANWSWVTTYGGGNVTDETALNADGSFNASLRTVVLSGTGASAGRTLDGLPSSDVTGLPYTYRVVERVTGSYSANGTEIVSRQVSGGMVRLVALAAYAGANVGVTFTNTLDAVNVSGTKVWADRASGLIPDFNNGNPDVTLCLERSVDGTAWTTATKADGDAPVVVWAQTDDTHWAFSYSGLPKTDARGMTYLYRVRELNAASRGYVVTYASDAAVDASTGDVTTATITNTVTAFTLDKKGDSTTGSAAEALNGATLKVRSGGKTYGIWTRDEDGGISSYVNRSGVSEGEDDESDLSAFTQMAGSVAGEILGIPVGNYVVHEAVVPSGHVRAADIALTVREDGSIVADRTRMSGDVPTVTMVDKVFRGNVELTKYFMHGSTRVELTDITFDLYEVVDGAFTCVARNISWSKVGTDSQGRALGWATGTAAGAVGYERDAKTGESVLGKYFVTSQDGLPCGAYTFVESGTSPYVATAVGSNVDFTIAGMDGTCEMEQEEPVYVQFANSEFNAAAVLGKVNSESGAAIDGAQFLLEYWQQGASSTDKPAMTCNVFSGKTYSFEPKMTGIESSADSAVSGQLELEGLKKGRYRLTELSCAGYEVGSGDEATVAEWTVVDVDQGAVRNLATSQDVQWTNASFRDSSLANKPLHGSISCKKVSSGDAFEAIDGARFGLMRWSDDDGSWHAACSDTDLLETGSSYAASVDEDGVITGFEEEGSAESRSGVLTVTNLPWGTYKLVERTAAAGYVIGVDGSCETRKMTIDVNNAADTVKTPLTDTVSNAPSELALFKASLDGTSYLGGALFTVEGDFADASTIKTLKTAAETGRAEPVTEDDGVSGQLIVGNTYTITETRAPEGYLIDADTAEIRVKLEADGTYTVVGETPSDWTVESEGGLTQIVKRDEMNSIGIAKRGEDGLPLRGATLTVTGKLAGGESSITVEPDGENALALLDGKLIAGNVYTVSEDEAPFGYSKLSDVEIRALANGTIEFASDDVLGWSIAEDGHVLVATDTQTSFTLAKTDEDGHALEGVTFKVSGLFAQDADEGTAADESRLITIDASDAGSVLVGGALPEGTKYVDADGAERVATGVYAVKETEAPMGYLSSEQTFELHVSATGELSGEGGSDFELDADAGTLTLADAPIHLNFKKLSRDGRELSGALFDVTGRFATASGALEDEETRESLTCEELVQLRFAQGQTYTFREVKAPAGYELNSDELSVTVDAGGTLLVDEDAALPDAWSISEDEDGAQLITLADTPIELALRKVDQDGAALSGAEFALTALDGGTFADGSITASVVSGEDGTVELPVTVSGVTYRLSESKAPKGYQQLDGSVDFTVCEGGTMTLEGASEDVCTLESDATEIRIVNTRLADGDPSYDDQSGERKGSPSRLGLVQTGDNTGAVVCAVALLGLLALGEGIKRRRRVR